ncbi:hypothetical protein [Thiothrix winogradskyi]|uniref:Uncharacterized protein n=1 Tax=Thiothrix winogradskyi TaxID=96472 RepID=A0ABY3T128_9GAMM|nr:hypothetical protein [Thiothrix winogradskyi]UJS24665.1 hypothetical protein L2Y54_01130 [Thiothrix winogradskyi]
MYRRLIQLQAMTEKPLRAVMYDARTVVSRICGGLDDMQQLGNKALVIRAEIFADRLMTLVSALSDLGLKVDTASLPDVNTLETTAEYPITVQISSFASDTDARVTIPQIPG